MEAEKHNTGGGAPLRTAKEKSPQKGLKLAWAGVVAMGLLIVLAAILCGCSTAKRSSSRAVSDSVVIRFKDSIVIRVKDSLDIRIKDSVDIHIKDSVVIVTDEAGNIKSKESWHSAETLRNREASTDSYKTAESTLNAEAVKSTAHTEKEATVKEYKANWLDRIKLATWPFLVAVIVSAILVWFARTKLKL